MTSVLGRKLALNSVWNLVGQAAPLVIAVALLPLLISRMGLERYGFLTLVWVLIGYASLFDFGIGRALTRVVSMHLGRQDTAGARHVADVGLVYLGLFGVLIGLVLAAAAPWLATDLLKVPPALQQEVMHSLWLLAPSIPFVLMTAGYEGVMVAHQRFGVMNVLKVALGVATFLGPLVIVLYENRLEYVVAFVVAMRVLSNSVHRIACRKYCDYSFTFARPDRETSRQLFSLGGWMSVSNLVSPLLSYLDRFILGGLVAIQMMAYYATAHDLVSRTLMMPLAIMGAVFPVAAGMAAGSAQAQRLFHGSVRVLFVVMVPITYTLFVLAHPGLELWLGADFARYGAPILQIMSVGILFNTMAQAPAAFIQASGNPKWMAQLHLAELPVFLFLLWWLTKEYGVIGTALATALRYSLDAIAVMVIAWRGVLKNLPGSPRGALVGIGLACAMFGLAATPQAAANPLLAFTLGMVVFALWAWRKLATPHERSLLLGYMRPQG